MPEVSLIKKTQITYKHYRKDYDDWIKQAPLDNQMALRIEFESRKEAINLSSAIQVKRRRAERCSRMTGLKYTRRGNVVFLWREKKEG